MKVLQVTGGISPRYGGSKALLGMCRELRSLGVETPIATTDSDIEGSLKVPLGRLVEVEGALVYHFSSPVLSKYGFSWELSSWLRSHISDYDLVHFHGIFSHGLISGVPSAQRFKVPYLIRPMGMLGQRCMKHGRIRKLAFLLALGRRYLNGAATIHYTAREEQEDAERLGIRARGVVIPLGVDKNDFDPSPYGTFRQEYPMIGGRKIVLFMSRLDPIKGLELLIEAVKSLSGRRDDFVLVIAGEGKRDYEAKIRTMVRRAGLLDRTVLTGFISGNGKRSLLRDADIFALPSYHENFGMAIAEAMGSGLPVLVSNQVGIHREIGGSGAGIVTACDSVEISAGLRRLLDDDTLRHQMGGNARNLVEKNFRWKTIAPKLILLYQSVLRQST